MQLCHISPISTGILLPLSHRVSPASVYSSTPQPRPCLLRNHKSPPLTFAPVVLRPSHKTAKFCTSPVAQPHCPIFCTYYPFHRPLPTTVRPVMCVPLRIFSLFRILHTPNMSDFFASFILYLQRFRTCFTAEPHISYSPPVLPPYTYAPLPTCFTASPSLLLHIFFATNLPASDLRLSFVRGAFCSLLRTCCAAVRSPVFFVYFYNSASLLSLPFSEILFSFSSNPAPHPCSRTAPGTRLKQKRLVKHAPQENKNKIHFKTTSEDTELSTNHKIHVNKTHAHKMHE